MPLYEYLCRDCGAVTEHLVLGRDETIACPQCGGVRLSKLLSVTANYQAHASGLPGVGDTACCGYTPGQAPGCAGPGSCCGKS